MKTTIQLCVQLTIESPMSDADKAQVRDDLHQLLITHFENNNRNDFAVSEVDVLPMIAGAILE